MINIKHLKERRKDIKKYLDQIEKLSKDKKQELNKDQEFKTAISFLNNALSHTERLLKAFLIKEEDNNDKKR